MIAAHAVPWWESPDRFFTDVYSVLCLLMSNKTSSFLPSMIIVQNTVLHSTKVYTLYKVKYFIFIFYIYQSTTTCVCMHACIYVCA